MKKMLLLTIAAMSLIVACRKEDQPQPQQGLPPGKSKICQICIHKDTLNDPNIPHHHRLD